MNSNLGIVRNIDNLGRVVMPKEYRNELGMDCGSPVSMTLEGDAVVIRKRTDVCQFCGSGRDLIRAGGVRLCRGCAQSIINLLAEE